jgi:hypothetical protein
LSNHSKTGIKLVKNQIDKVKSRKESEIIIKLKAKISQDKTNKLKQEKSVIGAPSKQAKS